MPKAHRHATRKPLKIIAAILGTLILLPVLFTGVATFKPQMMIGLFQAAFGSVADSSYDPRDPDLEGVQPDGQYRVSNIQYATEYPNSYFDIVYAGENIETPRPTLVYVHGGGFFFGSKQSGDPLAGADSNALFQAITDAGYNIVTVDYALVPGDHFPTPLHQFDQFLTYLTDHAADYHLDISQVDFFGQSAGSIILSQYFTAATNPDYAQLVALSPSVDLSTVGTLALDDGPLTYSEMNLFTKFMIGNYVGESIYLSEEQQRAYNPIPFVNEKFPRSFVIGSDGYGQDMVSFTDAMSAHGVQNKLVWPKLEDGSATHHTFISSIDTDLVAQRTFDQMITYLKNGR